MKRMKFIFPVFLLFFLSGFVPKSNQGIKVSADPMPTNINIKTMEQAELEDYYLSKGTLHSAKGETLQQKLNEVIKGHREYNFASDTDRYIFKIIDRNWELSPLTEEQLSNFDYARDNPYIHKLYADYNFDLDKADLFKNPTDIRVSFDKEHIWAQSLGNFGRKRGAGSDFHALWPSDVRGNQHAHNNYNFAVPTQNIVNVNNDKGTYVGRYGQNPLYPGANVFEPLDEYKGDIARAMLYMPIRYFEYEDSEHPKLELVNISPGTNTASRTNTGKAGVLEMLLEWHELDPVSPYEIKRNNLLYYNYQQNRNPFIDFPEWARIAYDTSYAGDGVLLGEPEEIVPDEPTSETSETSEPGEVSETSEEVIPTSESEETKKGCRGSLAATMSVSLLLVALLFVLVVRRHKLV